MYRDLKTLFHISSEEADRVYRARMTDGDPIFVSLTKDPAFFYLMAPEVYSRLLEAERLDRRIDALASDMPEDAMNHYVVDCMIDEIILTNDIEGVVSTRKDIEKALDALQKNDRRVRFQGIVNKYQSLALSETVPLETSEDVRALYDELVLEEVIKEDPAKAPDGKLFRKDTVSVVDAAQKVIHQNTFSEEQITSELSKALSSFNDRSVEPLIRAAVFHFVFAYIHPFYDGNGRMNRFMSSYLISREFSRYAGIRLSFSVKENIRAYYKAFSSAEHPLNRGDITPFILAFLDIVIDALQKTYDALFEKKQAMETLKAKLKDRFDLDAGNSLYAFGESLIEASLFTERGLSIEDLAHDLRISEPTVYKRLSFYEDAGTLVKHRSGRRNYYVMDTSQL